MSTPQAAPHHWMTRIVESFLGGNLSVLLIVISLLVGAVSLQVTPREEDPQIVVPVADVLVTMPGATAAEVERQVATRLEKLLYQIDGVEHVYSTSYPSMAVVTVRFYVGQDRERSWVKLHNKISANTDQVPPGVTAWVVKPVEIDDAPVVGLTLYSGRYSDFELRRLAEELEIRLQAVDNTGRTYVVGGRPREISVRVSPQRMASRGICLSDLRRAIEAANVSLPAGEMVRGNQAFRLQAGRFLATARDVADLIIGVHELRPVYLKEVADVADGPAEAETYTHIAFGPAAFAQGDPAGHGGVLPAGIERLRDYPAVTVAVAKRKGANAVRVSEAVQREAARFARDAFPEGVYLRVTRDNGHNADEKVNDLVESLVVAIAIVIPVLAFAMGWREGIIIALAVPITFSLTLLVNYLLGYTINRVTLFALILALGLVVDDPTVDVENISRHFAMRKEGFFRAVITAVNEVRPPIILATLAVIVSFLPMFFITGMMGPYMAPMALNVPISMLMSLMVAFTITPWLSYHMLRGAAARHEKPFVLEESGLYRFYRALLSPVLRRRSVRLGILALVLALLALAGGLVAARRVPLKMLPFDNKNELQVVVDMDDGTSLERTEAATAALARYLVRVPEATDVATYVGTSSPADFNGLIRHYYMRQGATVADIRFNLLSRKARSQQSHAIGLRLRNDLTRIAREHGANVKLVETPPGPPVIATLVAEVTGPVGTPYEDLAAAARRVRAAMEATPGVVDVDDVLVAPQRKAVFRVDRTKAALHGIPVQQLASLLSGAVTGVAAGALRLDDQVHPTFIRLRLPREDRELVSHLEQFSVRGAGGRSVLLSELGAFEEETIEQPIYHKNLQRVVYVFGETAGTPPPEAVLALTRQVDATPELKGFDVNWAGEGEWEVTLRAFRDLGIAFGVAVVGIYILLLHQTGSYLLPAIQLLAIPLSVIGIVPGFWLLNVVSGRTVGGWSDPVYFTATAMIGMIALAGIATRNAVLLIEFVEERKKEGKPLVQSLIEAGALRTRAIFLTSVTSVLAAWPITLDPIFSGLAWALIFGLVVSTTFTLVVVPMVYYMAYAKRFHLQAAPTVSPHGG